MWRNDPLLVVILWWTALFAGVLVWLPLVRGATQGTAYQWALGGGIGGRGIGGAYWHSFSEQRSYRRSCIWVGGVLTSPSTGCCWCFICRWRRR